MPVPFSASGSSSRASLGSQMLKSWTRPAKGRFPVLHSIYGGDVTGLVIRFVFAADAAPLAGSSGRQVAHECWHEPSVKWRAATASSRDRRVSIAEVMFRVFEATRDAQMEAAGLKGFREQRQSVGLSRSRREGQRHDDVEAPGEAVSRPRGDRAERDGGARCTSAARFSRHSPAHRSWTTWSGRS
jgi:hypothetical protein